MNRIFENYEAFYNMVLSASLLSNSQNENYYKDCTKMIEYICDAYSFEEDLKEIITNVIVNRLSKFGLNSDKEVEKQNRAFENHFDYDDMVDAVKCDVLDEIEVLFKRFSNYQKNNYFDYSFYHIYEPKVRYFELNASAKLGVVSIVRLLGVMNALGIGCEKDIDKAIIRFTQCMYWGDITSMYLLKHVYKKERMKTEMNVINDLIILSEKYLNLGITVLPENVTACKEAQKLYIFISSILQDVVINLNKTDITFSFVEAMLLENVSYEEKLDLINRYRDERWKVLTNAVSIHNNKVGF